jgi:hypothetical protein
MTPSERPPALYSRSIAGDMWVIAIVRLPDLGRTYYHHSADRDVRAIGSGRS